MNSDALVLCAGTLQHAGFVELCDAALAGGFSGITLYPTHVRRARAAGLSFADMREVLGERGLAVADLDPLLNWIPGDDYRGELAATEDEWYEIASALDARSLNLAQIARPQIEIDEAAAALAGVCDRAAAHGLLVTLEYLPWAGIPDAATALAIVERSARANATLMIDTWHSFRGPTTEAQLRSLPAHRVGSIQINDAPREPLADLLSETISARLLPGEGAIPLAHWLRLLHQAGVRAPIGVEVFSRELDALPAAEAAKRCGDAARRVLAAARAGDS
jgi:sugar phosphate isomerase/epimerase